MKPGRQGPPGFLFGIEHANPINKFRTAAGPNKTSYKSLQVLAVDLKRCVDHPVEDLPTNSRQVTNMASDLKELDGLVIDPPGKGPFNLGDLVAVKVDGPEYRVARVLQKPQLSDNALRVVIQSGPLKDREWHAERDRARKVRFR